MSLYPCHCGMMVAPCSCASNTSPHDSAARRRFNDQMAEQLFAEMRWGWAIDYDTVLGSCLWVQLRLGILYTEPLNGDPLFTEAEAVQIDAYFEAWKQRNLKEMMQCNN